MDIKNLMGKAEALTGMAEELTSNVSVTVSKILDEFNAALPVMKALGFSVVDLQVGMGLLPEVKARLIADADNIDVRALDKMIQKTGEQKTLVAVLKALQTAYNVRAQLGELGLKSVEINATLGIPPNISIGFLKQVAVAAPLPAMATA